MNGWRTIIAETSSALSLSDECLLIRRKLEDNIIENRIPIEQIRDVLIFSQECSVTVALLNRLIKAHVNVVFCDESYDPCCELLGLNLHSRGAGCLMDQIDWTQERKDEVWQQIVTNKIMNQRLLLDKLKLPSDPPLSDYETGIEPGDRTNREGQAARLYFHALFGGGFIRFAIDETNAALNYGYTILRSAMTRILVMHGYNTALGIHHVSRENSVNLACDLMEPFRPLVDEVVFYNAYRPLDWEYKKLLISLLHSECMYKGKCMDIDTAMDAYAVDVMKSMTKASQQIGRVELRES